MKNILTITVLLCFFSSCKKILVEEPKSTAAEVFYNTNGEVEAALNAIYSPLRESNCMGGLYLVQQETYSDYMLGRGSYAPLNTYQTLDNTNITRIGQIWDLFYRAIRNANLVIKNVPKGTGSSAADKKKYIGEAKFMRAFIYFTMVRNWAGLPIRTDVNLDSANIKRSSAAAVYNLIVADLLEAEATLPDVTSVSGRPTKWAAKTVLADVYLQLQLYADARDKSEEVIVSNKHSLVEAAVSNDFEKIFGPNVVTTAEEIFSLKFSRQGTNQGFYFVMFPHHPGAALHGAGGFFAVYTDTNLVKFVKNWDKLDIRRSFNMYFYNIGLGTSTFLFQKYKDPAAATQTSAGNDYPLYRYADILLLNAEAAAQANGSPTALALERLNRIHRRGYGRPSASPSVVDFTLAGFPTLQSFIDEVSKERGYETMLEGKRWLELKRLGKAQAAILLSKNATVANKFLLWPIPQSELLFNSAMDPVADQNPGY